MEQQVILDRKIKQLLACWMVMIPKSCQNGEEIVDSLAKLSGCVRTHSVTVWLDIQKIFNSH